MTSLIAVVGATGKQGGSVARSLLTNTSFSVRAITRNPDSEASQSLASLGAEIFKADGFVSNEMLAAFKNVWGAFINLNSDDSIWKNATGPTEFDVGKIIIDAAAKAGVQHIVYSSGPPCTAMTNGQVSMKAMDMKYKVEQYAKQLGKFHTVTPVNAAWYLENFLTKEVAPVFGGFPYFPDDDGYLTFRVPNWGGDNQVPFLSIRDDFGDIVQGIFLDPKRWAGHTVHCVSDFRSFDQLVADFEQVTGRKSRFLPLLPSWEAFDTHGVPELEDVKLMFAFTQITGGRYFGPEPSESRTAMELKKTTGLTLGRSEQGQHLVKTKEWFQTQWVS